MEVCLGGGSLSRKWTPVPASESRSRHLQDSSKLNRQGGKAGDSAFGLESNCEQEQRRVNWFWKFGETGTG